MLFLLTGDVQIGKTRWLEAAVKGLVAQDVAVEGVLAPGVWRGSEAGKAAGCSAAVGAETLEKIGIDNVLLPDGERVSFARRRDLALAEGTFREESQSARAKLAWEISDDALAQVNAHFDRLKAADPPHSPGLLVVDELGQLELLRGGGLTSAMDVLSQGPSARSAHALVVVRAWLLEAAAERFGDVWGGAKMLAPDGEARSTLRSAFDLV
ncbi:MAG: hypothetical protein PEGG_02126 [Paraeggerthella hongkongensis]|jgi:predicted ATPase|uniref:hypothetical protein n=1 Tax=Paraeggerthella sp. Marseille-Q4926 TaxID=2866587 RepID=UPI001CE4743B|nr:hypothetical protein [Paraeggerthella sp. Marseille-Q4926]